MITKYKSIKLVLFSLLLIIFQDCQVSNIIYVKKDSSLNDDTEKIQQILDQAGNQTVIITPGNYLIDATKSLNIRSNTTLIIDSNAVLKALPNNSNGYAILKLKDVTNVVIKGGGTILGERYEHTGTTGEWGMGIHIDGSDNFRIEGITIKNCWGDGIYIKGNPVNNQSKNGKIIGVSSLNNRRQGLSIISGKNILVNGGIYAKTNGIPPEGGIDLEPNQSGYDKNENIQIINAHVYDNKGDGLIVSGYSNQNILIDSCTSINNHRGITVVNVGQDNSITNNSISDNLKEGIKISCKKDMVINNLKVVGNNVFQNKFEGITLWNNIENSIISNNECYSNGYHGLHLRPTKTGNIRNNLIEENFCHSNSQHKDEVFSNIYIGENANNNIIKNNKTLIGENKNKPAYGLFIFYNAPNNTVLDNKVENGGVKKDYRNASEQSTIRKN